jgi:hypothetical protein
MLPGKEERLYYKPPPHGSYEPKPVLPLLRLCSPQKGNLVQSFFFLKNVVES